MGLGKILGSISPAFGLVSGKGLFGDLGHALGSGGGLGGLASMGGLGLLLNLIGGHHGADSPAPPPSPAGPGTMPGTPQGPSDLSFLYPNVDPTLLPQGAGARQPSAINNIGSALMKPGGGTDPSAGLGFAQAPQLQHGGLQAILQSLGVY